MNVLKRYLEVLFNEGETTAFGNLYSVNNRDVSLILDERMNYELVCINPLKDKRSDKNVVYYRNFLIEFDEGDLNSQWTLIENSGLPYSSITFSGNKSLHVIISLDIPVTSREEYDNIAWRLLKMFPTADSQCKNPSRSTRIPNALRKPSNTLQKLLKLKGRVNIKDLNDWLDANNIPKEKPVYIKNINNSSGDGYYSNELSPWSKSFVLFGAPAGEWNHKLFCTSCEAAKKNIDIEDFYNMLEEHTPQPLDKKDISTIRSAYKRIEEE